MQAHTPNPGVRAVGAVCGPCRHAPRPAHGEPVADAIPRWKQTLVPNRHLINVCENELEQTELTGIVGFTFDQLSMPLDTPLHK